MSNESMEDLKRRIICYACIGDDFLSSEIEEQGKRRKCSYCNSVARGESIDKLAVRVEKAFEEHYTRTSTHPESWQLSLLCDKESSYEWEREGQPVVMAIMDAVEIPEKAAQDIQRILEDKYSDFDSAIFGEETEFDSDSYYEEIVHSDTEWQAVWNSFEHFLKTEARYFSQKAAQALSSIFDGIATMHGQDGKPLLVEAGPKTAYQSFYRARVFQSELNLKQALKYPDRTLGPPPSEVATAGRMNAHGISVFYGATDPAVAVAEVRPPVGSSVAVAQFDIIKPIRLLDLSALEKVFPSGSFFDPEYVGIIRRAKFLRSLCQKMVRPVMPNDEPLEYLATQAVADFLATDSTCSVDGILFPSVQVAGDMLNVVLFNKASKIKAVELPPGTEIKVDTCSQDDDGWYRDYSVTEYVPNEDDSDSVKPTNQASLLDFETFVQDSDEFWDAGAEEPTIQIVLESIKIHIVEQAQYKTESHDVSRNRLSKIVFDFFEDF